jgi:hypothetical protein
MQSDLNTDQHAAVLAMLQRDLGIDSIQLPPDEDIEVALLSIVSAKVGELMTYDLDFLLSMLYRLDVLEEKIKAALKSGEATHIALARIIIARQKLRYASKQNSFKPLPDDMQDLAW